MTQIVPLAEVSQAQRGGAISIGNFDGVHRGHAALLAETRRQADRLGGPALAVILDPHPATILRPGSAPPKLTWLERRADLMSPLGVDFLIVCETTPEFLRMSPEVFFESLVLDRLGGRGLVEGPNFFFGHQRRGDVALLERMCRESGIELQIADPLATGDVPDEGTDRPPAVDSSGGPTMISSTRIRSLIAAGDVETAAAMMGQPHQLRGVIGHGDKRGRRIGFPTANLQQIDVLVPALGVYGGRVQLGRTARTAAIHIGPTPTFDRRTPARVEVHVLDFDGDLYDQMLHVDVLCRVRDIARFDSSDELAAQLARDIQAIRGRLESG